MIAPCHCVLPLCSIAKNNGSRAGTVGVKRLDGGRLIRVARHYVEEVGDVSTDGRIAVHA